MFVFGRRRVPADARRHPGRMPVFSSFLEGRCGAEACPYLHSPTAPVCIAFVAGFCPRGLACTLRHSLVCPARHPAPLEAAHKWAAPAPLDAYADAANSQQKATAEHAARVCAAGTSRRAMMSCVV
jgi:hypothetical protein